MTMAGVRVSKPDLPSLFPVSTYATAPNTPLAEASHLAKSRAEKLHFSSLHVGYYKVHGEAQK